MTIFECADCGVRVEVLGGEDRFVACLNCEQHAADGKQMVEVSSNQREEQ